MLAVVLLLLEQPSQPSVWDTTHATSPASPPHAHTHTHIHMHAHLQHTHVPAQCTLETTHAPPHPIAPFLPAPLGCSSWFREFRADVRATGIVRAVEVGIRGVGSATMTATSWTTSKVGRLPQAA